ncbi:MAG: hypothetical protein NC238_05140 [Dehalobacter sp.]|nr:hypothetical protein [Dehalobacter sp.]
MNEKITLTANIVIRNGPSINLFREIEVDAYEKINVDINDGDSDKEVDLWPSDTEEEVVLLAIVSSWYGEDLSYKVNEKVEDVTQKDFKLDQPHLLIGKSSVTMLDKKPKKLLFSYAKPSGESKAPDSVKIQILVGLDNF